MPPDAERLRVLASALETGRSKTSVLIDAAAAMIGKMSRRSWL